ncbi:MAG: hypothetical protein ABIR24_04075 [Verrucomicrobiota bacterium]
MTQTLLKRCWVQPDFTLNSRSSVCGWVCVVMISYAATLFCGCATPQNSTPKQSRPKNRLVVITNALSGEKIAKYYPGLKPTTGQKFNPVFWFGNIDDPVPPEWYRPNKRMRNVLWNFRNPFHNLFFYVIGIADKEFEIVGRFPGKISNPNGGWNWTVCKYKWLRLPFVSYKRGDFNFYLGWRNRGNFGMKLNFSK